MLTSKQRVYVTADGKRAVPAGHEHASRLLVAAGAQIHEKHVEGVEGAEELMGTAPSKDAAKHPLAGDITLKSAPEGSPLRSGFVVTGDGKSGDGKSDEPKGKRKTAKKSAKTANE